MVILGFDPGRDKCGVAVVGDNQQVYYHQVVAANDAIATVKSLCSQFSVQMVVMGNQTTSQTWKQQMRAVLPKSIHIAEVDERYSSLEARDRYWEMYPPQGLSRLLPQGMRVPPRPIDDIVAIILVERYQAGN
ncbi:MULTISPECIES: pre-16S rRNA-processing nuclease YqgF [Limnospira]|uniref:Resolvase, RNase H-like fold n=1 Tax=Limnospira indica PCC 8005 TaxID=376219 RepID=A0A9P1KF17_9CYAN|nr:MAG: pre-16S rRNA-processing nuclease YqgF [Limnospira indica BM01]CDM95554.1 putative resolvase, RNase H-like fold [Limnospira indica PCC 8005]